MEESESSNVEEGEKKKQQEVRFQDIFPDIQEDEFESSDDDDEKKKNERLERLG